MIKEVIDLLGMPATDRITGRKGVITSACFDLYGCIQVVLTPTAKADGELVDGCWFDVNRVAVDGERIMPVPQFDERELPPSSYQRGAAPLPAPRQ